MITIKEGAKIKGIQPEILVGLAIIDKVFTKYGIDLIITEGTGGVHMQGSLHYVGQALDIRSNRISDVTMKKAILNECQILLGDEYDMIIEDLEQPNEHYHAEFQPKGK